MLVAVTGSTGLIGTALVRRLTAEDAARELQSGNALAERLCERL